MFNNIVVSLFCFVLWVAQPIQPPVCRKKKVSPIISHIKFICFRTIWILPEITRTESYSDEPKTWQTKYEILRSKNSCQQLSVKWDWRIKCITLDLRDFCIEGMIDQSLILCVQRERQITELRDSQEVCAVWVSLTTDLYFITKQQYERPRESVFYHRFSHSQIIAWSPQVGPSTYLANLINVSCTLEMGSICYCCESRPSQRYRQTRASAAACADITQD